MATNAQTQSLRVEYGDAPLPSRVVGPELADTTQRIAFKEIACRIASEDLQGYRLVALGAQLYTNFSKGSSSPCERERVCREGVER